MLAPTKSTPRGTIRPPSSTPPRGSFNPNLIHSNTNYPPKHLGHGVRSSGHPRPAAITWPLQFASMELLARVLPFEDPSARHFPAARQEWSRLAGFASAKKSSTFHTAARASSDATPESDIGQRVLSHPGSGPEQEPRSFTIDEALTALGFGRFQWLLLGYTGLAWAAEAMELLLLSFVGPAAASEWGLVAGQEALLSSVVFVGMLVGAYGWGLVADTKGRRTGFTITALFTVFAGLSSALAPSFPVLLLTRALVGVGLGGAPVVFSLFMEFVPPAERGAWMIGVSLFWTAGSVVEAALAWAVLPTLGWRWLVAISAVPFLILLICFPFLPESPRFFLGQSRPSDALDVLKRVSETNNQPLPLGQLSRGAVIASAGYPSSGQGDSLGAAETAVQLMPSEAKTPFLRTAGTAAAGQRWLSAVPLLGTLKGAWGKLELLFSPPLRRTTGLLWAVFFGNAFSYYGFVLLTTQVSSTLGLGCAGHASTHLLAAGDADSSSAYSDILVTSAGELPGLLLAAFLIDRIGRKQTMASLLFGASLCSFSLLLLFGGPLSLASFGASGSPLQTWWTSLGISGVTQSSLTLLILFLARACVMGAFQTAFSYAPEVYPTPVRTTGLGAANAFSRLGGIACPFVAVNLTRSCNEGLAFALFGIIPLLASGCSLLFPMETSQMHLIEEMSANKNET